jgi:hypothetical protein
MVERRLKLYVLKPMTEVELSLKTPSQLEFYF